MVWMAELFCGQFGAKVINGLSINSGLLVRMSGTQQRSFHQTGWMDGCVNGTCYRCCGGKKRSTEECGAERHPVTLPQKGEKVRMSFLHCTGAAAALDAAGFASWAQLGSGSHVNHPSLLFQPPHPQPAVENLKNTHPITGKTLRFLGE